MSITTQLRLVWDFQETFGHPQTTGIDIGKQDRRKFRLDLFLEELGEFTKATYEGDKVEQLDGVVDMVYILLGSVHYHGLGEMFDSFVAGEPQDLNTPITDYPTQINIIVNEFKSNYIYGNITYGNLLSFHSSLCGLLLSLALKMEQEGITKPNSFADAFLEVHQSNMSKLDKNGKPIFREDGKVLKSELYFKPNLKQFINE